MWYHLLFAFVTLVNYGHSLIQDHFLASWVKNNCVFRFRGFKDTWIWVPIFYFQQKSFFQTILEHIYCYTCPQEWQIIEKHLARLVKEPVCNGKDSRGGRVFMSLVPTSPWGICPPRLPLPSPTSLSLQNIPAPLHQPQGSSNLLPPWSSSNPKM